jgi:hypothetical protein
MILDMLTGDQPPRPPAGAASTTSKSTPCGTVLEEGFWAGMTLYPVTKCTPQRAADIIEMYGPERLMVNSAGDWGPSQTDGGARFHHGDAAPRPPREPDSPHRVRKSARIFPPERQLPLYPP